jgi:hypothetical protein
MTFPLSAAIDLQADSRAIARRWAMLALACVSISFWMLIHPYYGLRHDSVLYAVLALSRLQPAALGHDMFVRYGTQDHYTIFSPMFAAAIQAFGLERAAAILTFATHIAFFGAAWLLVRRLMPATAALLAVGVLVVTPSWYGSHSVFAYIEAFLTPRQSAEAFALAGIAAALYSRHLLAGVCFAIALLLHPIIAAAGVIFWIVLFPGMAWPKQMAAAAGVLGLAFIGMAATHMPLFAHFDAAWLNILQTRLVYLFPLRWSAGEWANTAVHVAVLGVGVGISSSDLIRRLCIAGLITAAIGMLFAIVGCDLLHVVIVGQMQTWRWLWLLGVLAALLSPAIAIDCWKAGDLGRAAAVLLLSAWLTRNDNYAFLPALLACGAAAVSHAFRAHRLARLVLIGSLAFLAGALMITVGEVRNSLQALDAVRAGHRHYLVRISEVQALAYGGLLPTVALALTAWAVHRVTRRGAVLLAGLGFILLLSLLPYSVQTWRYAMYPESRYAAFAPWREAIPAGAEVLWPDPPQPLWFEVGRASYWSLYQMAGLVFSRDLTMISTARETALEKVLPGLGRTANAQARMRGPCSVHGVDFYASWNHLGPTPYPPVAPDVEDPRARLYLYRCSDDQRG